MQVYTLRTHDDQFIRWHREPNNVAEMAAEYEDATGIKTYIDQEPVANIPLEYR
jgi:hypothetical protein